MCARSSPTSTRALAAVAEPTGLQELCGRASGLVRAASVPPRRPGDAGRAGEERRGPAAAAGSDETEDEDMDETGTVVVGVDGSPGSRAALEHALEDAARRRARLRVVAAVRLPEYWATAYGMGAYGMGTPPPPAEIVADVRAEAQRMVDGVASAHPDIAARVPVTVDAVAGIPAEVLLEASHGVDLLVLGHRGRGAFTSALLGSVGLQCVLHAACPVTIVRPVAAPVDPEAATSGAVAAPAPS